MVRNKESILLAWSGGKDSVLALDELRRSKEFNVVGLVSVLTEGEEKVTLHGIPRDLLEAQAKSIGLPLHTTFVAKGCCRKAHLDSLGSALAPFLADGIRKIAFGDLYLDDVRDFREEQLEALGLEAIFPLWQRDTRELSDIFLREKYKAIVTCIDEDALDSRYVGRPYDRTFLQDLPLSVDPCGENGEFHTFVTDGPLFSAPVPCRIGDKFSESPFHYCQIKRRKAAKRRPKLAKSS